MNIKDAIQFFIQNHNNLLSEKTICLYNRCLSIFCSSQQNKDLMNIKKENVENFISNIKNSNYQIATINLFIHSLNKFFKFCQKNNLINKRIYFKSIIYQINIKAKFIFPHDYNKIINSIIKEKQQFHTITNIKYFRDIAIVQLLIETGMTVFELHNLKIDDIDLEHKKIVIKEKNRPNRILPVCTHTILLLKDYLEENTRILNYFFTRLDRSWSSLGAPLTSRSIERLIHNYSNNNFSPKDLRHTYIITRLVAGDGLYEISDMVGGISDNFKSCYRDILNKQNNKIKYTLKDYDAYEYLRHKFGLDTLKKLFIKQKIKSKFSKEMIEKY